MAQQRTPTGQPVILSKLFRRLCLPSCPASIRSLSGLCPPSVQLGKGNILPQTKSSLTGGLARRLDAVAVQQQGSTNAVPVQC